MGPRCCRRHGPSRHWFGQTLDKNNGITSGYDIVEQDPDPCRRRHACAVTVQVDIVPIIVNIDGRTYDGTQQFHHTDTQIPPMHNQWLQLDSSCHKFIPISTGTHQGTLSD